MSTKIEMQTWSGGSGYGDRAYLLGYCKESPQEVLQHILLTHDVYHYKDLYRPIDYDFPNNVLGLVITEFNRPDLEIIGSLTDIDLSCAKTKHHRSQETVLKSIALCKKWHSYNNELLSQKYHVLFEEVDKCIKDVFKTLTTGGFSDTKIR